MEKREIFEDMGAFEAALIEKPVELQPPELRSIVLAVDRSNQDETAIAVAGAIAQRGAAVVHVVYAPEGEQGAESDRYREEVAAALRAQPWNLEAMPKKVNAPLPVHQIIAAVQESKADLVVVPAPYLRDVGLLGDESLSDTIDMLLAERPAPVLVVRQPLDRPADCFANVLVPMSVYSAQIGRAASWALRLVAPDGTIALLAVPDEAVLREAQKLLGDKVDAGSLGAEALERAETKEVGALIAAVQKRGAELGINVHVEVKLGSAVEVEAAEANRQPCLVCVGAPAERTAPAFHRAKDLLLRSRNPVLVV